MTFASFTQPNGVPVSITTEHVCAIRGLSPDTAAQVWTITDSSPGSSRGYVTVNGSFATVAAAFGVVPLVLLTDAGGAPLAINAAFATRVQALPGDTACRVTWAADQQGGYAIVQGTYAATTAALAYTPTPGGGTINGTIAKNEVAFGTALNTIGGSAQLEWNFGTNTLTVADPAALPVLRVDATNQINGKVTVTGGTTSCFSIESSIDGEFVSVDPSLFTVTVKDALSPGDYYANLSPNDVTVADNPAQTSGQVNGQGVQAFDAATTNFAALRVVSGVPTLLAQDTTTATDQPLNVAIGELRLAGNPGAPGEVLTSQGAGVPPSWAQPAPAAAALSFALNTSHNNVSPVDAGAFYTPGFTPSGTVAVFVDSSAANIATVRVVDAFGLPVWTFTDPFPSTGYRVIPPAASPALAAGWYRVDVACAGAGNVTLLGFYAA